MAGVAVEVANDGGSDVVAHVARVWTLHCTCPSCFTGDGNKTNGNKINAPSPPSQQQSVFPRLPPYLLGRWSTGTTVGVCIIDQR